MAHTSLRTALYDTHVALGAKMVPFAGFDMPVRYSGDKAEHLAVRQVAGLFDVSHMGEFFVSGPQALALVQHVTSNDASKLPIGKAQYSCFPNESGGIVDDCIVYHLGEESYMIVVNAANIEKDWNWIVSHNTVGAQLDNASERYGLLALSGPKAEAILQPLVPEADLSQLGTYFFWQGTFLGMADVIIATTGYTGERTFEIFIPTDRSVEVWDRLMEAGKAEGLVPAGLGARDTLRLEMGYMLYGNDIDDETSPLEAGLGWITKLKKGPFVGSEAIQSLKAAGLQRKLVGFVMQERGIPRHGYEIAFEGAVIGEVTSGSISPVSGEGIGLGYVPVAQATPGTLIDILIRNKPVKARVVKPPFIEKL